MRNTYLRLLMISAALLLSALKLSAAEVRLSPFAAWNEGGTYYTVWGGCAGDSDPLRFRSKLDFPLNSNLLGLRLTVSGGRPVWGIPWRSELSLAKNSFDRRSWAADSDWSSGGTVGPECLVSGIETKPLPVYYQLTVATLASRSIGKVWRIEAGPWYRLLYASYDLLGIYIFGTTVSPFGTQKPRVLFPDSLVIEYRAVFHLPGLIVNSAYERSWLRADASVVWMPWVAAFYRDDHVLRSLLGEADNRGRGFAYSLGARVPLPSKLSWLAAGARYEWMSVRTCGQTDVHYYDSTPVEPYTQNDSINLRQQTVTLFIDFKF